MKLFLSLPLLVTGVIHLIPVIGVFGTEKLQTLYGIDRVSDDLELLLRHRAVLFGIIGCLLLYSIFEPKLQLIAVLVGLASMLSFIGLAQMSDGVGAELKNVVRIDWICSVLLFAAIFGQQFFPSD